MKKALILIDYTKDFVASDGALTAGAPAQAIDARITALARDFTEAGEPVIYAVDLHREGDTNHPETKLFAPHNLAGTRGRELYGSLGAYYAQTKEMPNVRWMDKTRYSAFAGTDLYLRLREWDTEELHLCGVCTDICVLHTAVDAYNLGFALAIHADAVASFNAAGHDWALGHFTSALGARLV